MPDTHKFHVVIVAAGTGERTGLDVPKQYIELNGKTILRKTIDVFREFKGLGALCVVINPNHEGLYKKALTGLSEVILSEGGATRQKSVFNGIRALPNLSDNDIVLIHDAARPFVKATDILNLLSVMNSHRAATLATPVADTLCYALDNMALGKSIDRRDLWGVQTPQAFYYSVIKDAHEKAGDNTYTDDAGLVSGLGIPVHYVTCGRHNFKITTAEDLDFANMMTVSEIRTGMGFDVHAFDDDMHAKSVRLCGVDIAHDKKLKGHSDADVGLHALTDAILGAIGEGDIGQHFPPSDMKYKDMDSAVFLERSLFMLSEKGANINNLDITLVCEAPKIGPYRDDILKRLSELMGISRERINIKATTTEKLGFTGRGEGIAAQAVVSVSLPKKE